MTFIDESAAALRAINSAAEGALEEVARQAKNTARKNVTGGGSSVDQLNVRSGNLRAGIDYDMDKRGMASVARVGASAKYAGIHEFGGTIKARNAEYLTFKTRDGGWVRVKEVTMPARPYIRPSIMDHLPDVERTFAAHLAKKIGR
jgi:phage gpG-like protein